MMRMPIIFKETMLVFRWHPFRPKETKSDTYISSIVVQGTGTAIKSSSLDIILVYSSRSLLGSFVTNNVIKSLNS